MRQVTKKVYYCEFCKKHGLQRPAMEKHERYCTMNPWRECRWSIGNEAHAEFFLPVVCEQLRQRAPLDEADIAWLQETVAIYDTACPACMLAALRQSGVEYHATSRGTILWDYGQELERFRKVESEYHFQQDQPW